MDDEVTICAVCANEISADEANECPLCHRTYCNDCGSVKGDDFCCSECADEE